MDGRILTKYQPLREDYNSKSPSFLQHLPPGMPRWGIPLISAKLTHITQIWPHCCERGVINEATINILVAMKRVSIAESGQYFYISDQDHILDVVVVVPIWFPSQAAIFKATWAAYLSLQMP